MVSTLAERLGFAATDRVAVIHADDIGMCHAANEGAFAVLENGSATCGSIMVPCPWFREAAERARANPELDLGVHLTLNAEFPRYRWGPVAGRSAVPSLVDDEGALPRTSLEVVSKAKPEHVETELRAQIETALAAGIDVTHLDSHMGTCFFPPFIESYARLAEDYQIPLLAVQPNPELLADRGLEGKGGLITRVVEALGAAGVPLFDAIDANSLHFERGQGEAHNRERLAKLQPGVTYFICHPSRGGQEIEAITPDSAHMREFEGSFYGGESGRRALEDEGIQRVGMRALGALIKSS